MICRYCDKRTTKDDSRICEYCSALDQLTSHQNSLIQVKNWQITIFEDAPEELTELLEYHSYWFQEYKILFDFLYKLDKQKD
jgi:hypothetical protein